MAHSTPSFDDDTDFQNANRDLLRTLDPCVIQSAKGDTVYDNDAYAFLNTDCPPTAKPSLWRQAQLCSKQGLFQVVPGIYQVRGLDLSNISFIEGDAGVIVVDPLISVECAAAAWQLYESERGKRPVTGLIFTHSHLDHFGGAKCFLEQEPFPIFAPEGFFEHAVSENVYVGNAMARRAMFMYGACLDKGPAGQIGCGLGMTGSTGSSSFTVPNVKVEKTGTTVPVDGVDIVFQLTPGTEAPAEMNFFIPRYRSLCIAENASHNLHNIQTLRGALVRDARAWSHYLDEALVLFAHQSDVVFGSHHWPTWDQANVVTYLSEQRDLYAYLHDQTLRLTNQGYTGIEIAEKLTLPDSLARQWHAQGYYGSVSHNLKAIYHRYLGWFDGNPAHLWEHPPTESAQRYVQCMGGVDKVLELGNEYKDKGDLRFAATLLNHAVFATEEEAPKLALADVYERLAFGSENATWRNFYLEGAFELRHRVNCGMLKTDARDVLDTVSIGQLFDILAIRLDGPAAQQDSFVIDFAFTDIKQEWRLILSNATLRHRLLLPDGKYPEKTTLRLQLSREQLTTLVLTSGKQMEGLAEGDTSVIEKLFGFLVEFDAGFAIVTPKK